MRSLIKTKALLPIVIILISAYVFASASLINISKAPSMNNIETSMVISSYDLALFAEFNFAEEEYINDIPYSIVHEDALLDDFDFEDEEYINDIPCEIAKDIRITALPIKTNKGITNIKEKAK